MPLGWDRAACASERLLLGSVARSCGSSTRCRRELGVVLVVPSNDAAVASERRQRGTMTAAPSGCFQPSGSESSPMSARSRVARSVGIIRITEAHRPPNAPRYATSRAAARAARRGKSCGFLVKRSRRASCSRLRAAVRRSPGIGGRRSDMRHPRCGATAATHPPDRRGLRCDRDVPLSTTAAANARSTAAECGRLPVHRRE